MINIYVQYVLLIILALSINIFAETINFMPYSASNTNSCLQNYKWGTFYACPGSLLTISTCDLTSSGDLYLRLYNSGLQQVASNDDGCGYSSGPSKITYTLTLPCQLYYIDMGCYQYTSCSGQVSVSGTTVSSTTPNPTFSPTRKPTQNPTFSPTQKPTFSPTQKPTAPTAIPTATPTAPTANPTATPTAPTSNPTSSLPTSNPTLRIKCPATCTYNYNIWYGFTYNNAPQTCDDIHLDCDTLENQGCNCEGCSCDVEYPNYFSIFFVLIFCIAGVVTFPCFCYKSFSYCFKSNSLHRKTHVKELNKNLDKDKIVSLEMLEKRIRSISARKWLIPSTMSKAGNPIQLFNIKYKESIGPEICIINENTKSLIKTGEFESITVITSDNFGDIKESKDKIITYDDKDKEKVVSIDDVAVESYLVVTIADAILRLKENQEYNLKHEEFNKKWENKNNKKPDYAKTEDFKKVHKRFKIGQNVPFAMISYKATLKDTTKGYLFLLSLLEDLQDQGFFFCWWDWLVTVDNASYKQEDFENSMFYATNNAFVVAIAWPFILRDGHDYLTRPWCCAELAKATERQRYILYCLDIDENSMNSLYNLHDSTSEIYDLNQLAKLYLILPFFVIYLILGIALDPVNQTGKCDPEPAFDDRVESYESCVNNQLLYNIFSYLIFPFLLIIIYNYSTHKFLPEVSIFNPLKALYMFEDSYNPVSNVFLDEKTSTKCRKHHDLSISSNEYKKFHSSGKQIRQSYKCKICKSFCHDEHSRWHCSQCKYDKCFNCFPETDTKIRINCKNGHILTFQGKGVETNWGCDARIEKGGCRCNNNIKDKERWRCKECDFDYCGPCYDSKVEEILLKQKTYIQSLKLRIKNAWTTVNINKIYLLQYMGYLNTVLYDLGDAPSCGKVFGIKQSDFTFQQGTMKLEAKFSTRAALFPYLFIYNTRFCFGPLKRWMDSRVEKSNKSNLKMEKWVCASPPLYRKNRPILQPKSNKDMNSFWLNGVDGKKNEGGLNEWSQVGSISNSFSGRTTLFLSLPVTWSTENVWLFSFLLTVPRNFSEENNYYDCCGYFYPFFNDFFKKISFCYPESVRLITPLLQESIKGGTFTTNVLKNKNNDDSFTKSIIAGFQTLMDFYRFLRYGKKMGVERDSNDEKILKRELRKMNFQILIIKQKQIKSNLAPRNYTIDYKDEIYSTIGDVEIDGLNSFTSYFTILNWINSNDSNRSSYYDLPEGWKVAPDDIKSKEVIKAHTWSTRVVATKGNWYKSKGFDMEKQIAINTNIIPKCSKGHVLEINCMLYDEYESENCVTWNCNKCKKSSRDNVERWCCKSCHYDGCFKCFPRPVEIKKRSDVYCKSLNLLEIAPNKENKYNKIKIQPEVDNISYYRRILGFYTRNDNNNVGYLRTVTHIYYLCSFWMSIFIGEIIFSNLKNSNNGIIRCIGIFFSSYGTFEFFDFLPRFFLSRGWLTIVGNSDKLGEMYKTCVLPYHLIAIFFTFLFMDRHDYVPGILLTVTIIVYQFCFRYFYFAQGDFFGSLIKIC